MPSCGLTPPRAIVDHHPVLYSLHRRLGCCITAPQPSRFLLQHLLVALRTFLLEPYQPHPIPTRILRHCWEGDRTKSRAVGLPYLDLHQIQTFPGVIRETSQSSWQTPKTRCKLGCQPTSTSRFSEVPQDGLGTRRCIIATASTTTKKKRNTKLDSLKRILRYPTLPDETLVEPNISWPPS